MHDEAYTRTRNCFTKAPKNSETLVPASISLKITFVMESCDVFNLPTEVSKNSFVCVCISNWTWRLRCAKKRSKNFYFRCHWTPKAEITKARFLFSEHCFCSIMYFSTCVWRVASVCHDISVTFLGPIWCSLKNFCILWDFHSGVGEDSDLLGDDTASFVSDVWKEVNIFIVVLQL